MSWRSAIADHLVLTERCERGPEQILVQRPKSDAEPLVGPAVVADILPVQPRRLDRDHVGSLAGPPVALAAAADQLESLPDVGLGLLDLRVKLGQEIVDALAPERLRDVGGLVVGRLGRLVLPTVWIGTELPLSTR